MIQAHIPHRIVLSAAMPICVSEAALDTPAEIGSNHFVARRAMLLRMAEGAARNGEPYSARFTEIDRDFWAKPTLSFSSVPSCGTRSHWLSVTLIASKRPRTCQ